MDKFIIWHIADIHIKNGAHESILYAIDQLIEQIKLEQTPLKNQLVVIAGDVFEKKIENSVRDQDCFNRMIEKLNFIKILIIPGNHDFSSSSNNNDLNLLETALYHYLKLQGSQTRNIYLYSKSGNYQLNDFIGFNFTILSPADPVPINSLKINAQYFNICILHETIGNCKVNQIELPSNISTNDLEHFDLVLAGDIHKRLIFGSRNQMAYPGSLIQKTKAEGLEHGALKWTIHPKNKQCSVQEFNFKLRYAYLIMKATNDILEPFPKSELFQEIAHLDLFCSNCSTSQIDLFRNNILQKYKFAPRIFINPDTSNQIAKDQSPANYIESDDQFIILEKMVEQHSYKNEILNLHRQALQEHSDIYKSNKWTVTYLEWANMFGYKERSYINFESLKGINSIIGPNRIGKSAIIDILCFALFGDIPRDNNLIDIIYIGSNDAEVTCHLKMMNTEYIIFKKFRRCYKSLAYNTIHLYENRDGQTNEQHFSTIAEFTKEITKIIGSYNEIKNINISSQSDKNILNSRIERLKTIQRYYGLHVYEKITDSIKSSIKNNKAQLDNLNIKFQIMNQDAQRLQKLIDSFKYAKNFAKIDEISEAIIQKNLEIANNIFIDLKTKLANLESKKFSRQSLLNCPYSIDEFECAKLNIKPEITESKYLTNINRINYLAQLISQARNIDPPQQVEECLTLITAEVYQNLKNLDIDKIIWQLESQVDSSFKLLLQPQNKKFNNFENFKLDKAQFKIKTTEEKIKSNTLSQKQLQTQLNQLPQIDEAFENSFKNEQYESTEVYDKIKLDIIKNNNRIDIMQQQLSDIRNSLTNIGNIITPELNIAANAQEFFQHISQNNIIELESKLNELKKNVIEYKKSKHNINVVINQSNKHILQLDINTQLGKLKELEHKHEELNYKKDTLRIENLSLKTNLTESELQTYNYGETYYEIIPITTDMNRIAKASNLLPKYENKDLESEIKNLEDKLKNADIANNLIGLSFNDKCNSCKENMKLIKFDTEPPRKQLKLYKVLLDCKKHIQNQENQRKNEIINDQKYYKYQKIIIELKNIRNEIEDIKRNIEILKVKDQLIENNKLDLCIQQAELQIDIIQDYINYKQKLSKYEEYKQLYSKKDKLQQELVDLQTDTNSLSKKYELYEKYKVYQNRIDLINELNKLKLEYSSLNNDLQKYQKFCTIYNEWIQFEQNQQEYLKQQQLVKDLKDAKFKKQSIIDYEKAAKYKLYLEQLADYNQKNKELTKLKLEYTSLTNENETYQTVLKNQKIVDAFNKKNDAEHELKQILSDILQNNELFDKIKIIISNLDQLIKFINENRKDLDTRYEIEREISIKTEYLNLINPDNGLQFQLISKYLKNLIKNVNQILYDITDFEVDFSFSDETSKQSKQLDINIKENGKILNSMLSSGSQKFIIDLAFRICLSQNQFSLPNFLIIDEGFGSMDDKHLDSTLEFLNKIKDSNIYGWILIISHINDLHHICNQHITIKKQQGTSIVNFGDAKQRLALTEVKKYKQEDNPIQIDIINNELDNPRIFERNNNKYRCLACANKKFLSKDKALEHINIASHKKKMKNIY